MDNHYPADVTLKRINTIVGSYWEFPWDHSQIHHSFKEIFKVTQWTRRNLKKKVSNISVWFRILSLF